MDGEKRARYTYPEPLRGGVMPRFVGFRALYFTYSVRGSVTRTDASRGDSAIDQPTRLRDFPEVRLRGMRGGPRIDQGGYVNNRSMGRDPATSADARRPPGSSPKTIGEGLATPPETPGTG
ncbi:hypothetical protein GCM10018791_55060 [Streptomyces zaomyceticus]|nr:hypothetical protein GCM10018791_55060 [Streptomyces zaomyceticus]